MKRVLVITYYWPPSGGSGVQRWVKFAKYLPSEGWQPVIYTPENPELIAVDKTLGSEIPPEAEIVRTKIVEPYNAYRMLMGKDSSIDIKTFTQESSSGGETGASGGEVNPINAQKKSFKQKISLFIRGNFFIPDPRVMWVGPSVRFLKKYLREHPVDAIVTTGPPQSMHLIGLKLSEATGIPWVADFRDPWTKMFYFKHLGLCSWAEKKHHELERRVLDGATRVVAVSPLVKEDFEKMTGTPVELITNGFDESDFSEEIVPDGFFNITHTGLFAADGNPETLWKVLADKCAEDSSFRDALRLRLVGKTDSAITESIRQAGLGDNLVDLGYRDHRTAVREQKNASLLILPLRKEPEYRAVLPGKLFEYLASRRPILGIGQTDGAMARIIGNTGSGVVYDWDQESKIRACIDFCWDEFRQGELDDNSSDISEYTRRGLTHRYASLLDEITTEKKNHK
ncbi:MAG: glycosyltransferase [Candidatus Cryptobacteroides sp.]|uniref:glycosyltransferase n=1 Tax=Candidatus Cryptobacteroides sp. TaxID=2952915 RepID=UPI002A91DBFD|nr:glycosyltransferase [Candidatus Cryptobacteroides sp.]MDY5565969.1 glycosyltransferase [Candidatus Cryptobacteroides sp.]